MNQSHNSDTAPSSIAMLYTFGYTSDAMNDVLHIIEKNSPVVNSEVGGCRAVGAIGMGVGRSPGGAGHGSNGEESHGVMRRLSEKLQFEGNSR